MSSFSIRPTRASESTVLQILFAVPVLFAAITAISLLVTASLLREATYHYPLTLLFLQNLLLTAGVLLYPRLTSQSSASYSSLFSYRLTRPDISSLQNSLLPSFLIFVKQAALFEALLNLRSTTFVFLVLQPVVDIVQTPPVTPLVIQSSLARAFAVAIIVMNERDLDISGLFCMVLFAMAHLGEVAYAKLFVKVEDDTGLRAKLFLVTAVSFLGCVVFEHVHWALADIWRIGFIRILLVVGLPFGAWAFHGWLVMPEILGRQAADDVTLMKWMDVARDAIMIFLPVVFWNVLVSPMQVAAYTVPVFYTAKLMVGGKEERGPTIMHADGGQSLQNPGAHNRKTPIHKTPWAFSLAFLLLAGIPSSLRLYGHPAHVNHATLDTTYEPGRNLDIVVSMYREDVSQLKSLLTSIKNIGFISTLNPHVILYTKDPEADKSFLQKATGADEVKQLENVGGEGHTFLHHITANWDALASKTMFIPAIVHNRAEFLSRLKTYLNAQTGMLPLGPSNYICRCDSCADRWGWHDELHVIPKLLDGRCGNGVKEVAINVKGQFVVSAKRIRGRDKTVYAEQLKAIGSPMGEWPHTDPEFKGKIDSVAEPYYGYSLERAWGALMQCSDVDVARRCPTMLGGLLWGGIWMRRVGDCQCLDEKEAK